MTGWSCFCFVHSITQRQFIASQQSSGRPEQAGGSPGSCSRFLHSSCPFHILVFILHVAATALTSGTGTPTSATKAANRRTAAKNAKAAAASAVSATTASNVTVGGTVPATATSIATGAATISTSASATISPATAASAGAGQPTPAQAVAPGPTASAPKASKSRSKVQIDYSSEPSATYLAQLQASSGSSTLPASTTVTTPKSKAAAGE